MKNPDLFIRDVIKKIHNDKISVYASSACYFMLLSFFPFLLALLSLVRYLPIKEGDLLNLIYGIMPIQLKPLIESVFTDIYENSSTALTLITATALIWAAGKGFFAIVKGLKKIYNRQEEKVWIIQRIASCFYALFFMILIVVSLMFMVFGQHIVNFIERHLPKLNMIIGIFQALINFKHLLLPGILTIFFTLAFSMIAERRKKLYKELPGALFSALGWYIFTALYSLYVSKSPNFSYMYGSLTTLIFALIWIYCCIIIIFIGAEINYFINDYKSDQESYLDKKTQESESNS